MSQASATRTATPNVIGERIAQLMWRHSLTIATLSREIKTDRSLISLKMNNKRRWYHNELADIAMVLDTTVGYLTGETDDDRRPEHLPKWHSAFEPYDSEAKWKNAPDSDASEASEWARRGSNPRPAD